MAIVLRMGLKNLPIKGKLHSILVADTFIIGKEGAENLTDKCTKKFTEVSYELGEESEASEEKKPKAPKSKDRSYPFWFSMSINALIVLMRPSLKARHW